MDFPPTRPAVPDAKRIQHAIASQNRSAGLTLACAEVGVVCLSSSSAPRCGMHPTMGLCHLLEFNLAPTDSFADSPLMLLFRATISDDWLPKVLANLPAVLVDHAHLERKAATTALSLEKYRMLFHRVEELNAIAIEELQHFQLVLNLLKKRAIPFSQPFPSLWISGLMRGMRAGQKNQAIDHLICCAFIEGRSCEKFQILGRALEPFDRELAAFYASLVESEGNHYATYILMARAIDDAETDRRLDFFLDLDAKLIREPSSLPILH